MKEKKEKPKKVKLPTQKQVDKFAALIVQAKLKDNDISTLVTLLNLYKHGIGYIDAEFSGSGDSGDMYDVSFYPSEKKSGYKDAIEPEGVPFMDNFRDWLIDTFEGNVTCDWVNNDGGGGHIHIELPSLKMRITSYWNETVTNDCGDVELNLNPCAEE
jgi:hypothetical protein